MSEIASRVKAILADQMGVDATRLTDNASLVDDFGIDSLDAAEIVLASQLAFAIEIPSEHVESVHTVGDVVRYIESRAVRGVSISCSLAPAANARPGSARMTLRLSGVATTNAEVQYTFFVYRRDERDPLGDEFVPEGTSSSTAIRSGAFSLNFDVDLKKSRSGSRVTMQCSLVQGGRIVAGDVSSGASAP